MSDASTKRMISMYLEEASAPMFLAGYFRSPPENFHTTEEVMLDIQRDDEQVAIAIHDLTNGPRKNQSTVYTSKTFKPPIFDEETAVSAFETIKRMPGQNPFTEPNFAANAVRQAYAAFRKLELKIRRAVELMCAQVLQTGKLTLTDAAGVTLYEIDFSPKATHFVTPTAWATDGSTGDPMADIAALATVVRRDGKLNPKRLIFGASAWVRFLANAKVKAALDVLRLNIGMIAPETRGQGATFQGRIWIGNYPFEMWTYDGYYRDPATDTHKPYVDDNKVIMLGDGRLDLTFGAIPMIVPPDQRALPFLPPRIASEGRGLDLTTNAWVTPDGKQVMVSAGTRPLTIPTAIDTFGALKVAA